jgi:membrane protein implicated in regulation of membrane protease activity
MKAKISRICLIVYAILLILSAFLMAAPGSAVIWFCIMAVLAIPPIIADPKWHRILAIFALLIALMLAVSDYNAGKHRQNTLLERFNEAQKQQKEKSAPAGTK